MRSHFTRQASREDRKTFLEGAEAALLVLETMEQKDLELMFSHPRWGANEAEQQVISDVQTKT